MTGYAQNTCIHLALKSAFGNGLSMRLKDVLVQKKGEILKRWFDLTIQSYPEDTAAFFKQKKDHFANPVGSTLKKSLDAILAELFKENAPDLDTLRSSVDPIIRIRAIQDFSPSEAVSFVFSLKPIIRDISIKKLTDESKESELQEFESKIDALGLLAFDIYMLCREKLYELKANEVKNRTYQAFRRANLITENLPEETGG